MSPVAKMKTPGTVQRKQNRELSLGTVTVTTKVLCAVKAFLRGWSSQHLLPCTGSSCSSKGGWGRLQSRDVHGDSRGQNSPEAPAPSCCPAALAWSMAAGCMPMDGQCQAGVGSPAPRGTHPSQLWRDPRATLHPGRAA